MTTQPDQPWIPIERIEAVVQLEPTVVISFIALAAWAVYRLFLRGISEERHRNLRRHFSNLLMHAAFMVGLFGAYFALRRLGGSAPAIERISSYVGLLCLISGAAVFVKTWRILVFEYLFLGHMKVGVPILLVNLSTLILSIFIGGWLLTTVFNVKLVPILATSAILSLVLGLALQETLGNLFAGIVLQFDKPYEIGDWIEIQSGNQKWIGRVNEISWRSTVLIGLFDETIIVPNRVVANAEVSNFSVKTRPIIRSQVFRIAYGGSVKDIKEALLQASASVPAIRRNPTPLVILTEAHESWLVFKLVYFIDDYGVQFVIADQVIAAALDSLERYGASIAPPRLALARA